MKKIMLLTMTLALCMVSTTIFAQTLDDYVDETRGDTLVINSYQDMAQEPNSLLNAILEDSEAPEGRVYELKRNGWYPLLDDISVGDRPLVIAGAGNVSMAQGTLDDGYPPILSGIVVDDVTNSGGLFQFGNDVTIKNASLVNAADDGSMDWALINGTGPSNVVTLDNVMLESTRWVFVAGNDPNISLDIKNSYIVNMIGEPCRRNGGVYDNTGSNTNRIFVENTTHVMGAGVTYKMRSFPVNEVVFNHNTFVNISGQVFASYGHQSNSIVTNNLFVNANVQGYIPGLDYTEFDKDYLPHGLVNIDSIRTTRGGSEQLTLPDSSWITDNYPDIAVEDFGPDDRKVLVSNNGVFWHDDMDDIVSTLNDNNVPCPVDEDGSDCLAEQGTWVSQAITMNSRTQAMFDDDETYPYLNEGPWIEGGDPQFTDDGGLLGEEQLTNLVNWSVDAASTEPSGLMTHWRTEGNEVSDVGNYIYTDYPTAADLSYTNSAYLTASTDGQPLGDLNWFPEEKAEFESNYEAHYSTLRTALETGQEVGVSNERTESNLPTSIQLDQNYPNPFNPTTQISFNLPATQEISLKVYDMLGREVATIVNSQRYAAGNNAVTFDASNLSSGMYIYRLTSDNISISRKMTLIK